MKLENHIENVRRSLLDYENIEFESLYESFNHQKLSTIFSTLHHLITKNFKLMNDRLPTKENSNHFWAEPSRELITAIEAIRGLERALKNSKHSFGVDSYYDEILNSADSFLSNSGGSTIPPNMEKVILYYEIPIFVSIDTVTIPAFNDEYSFLKQPVGSGSYASVYMYHDKFYDTKFAIKTAKKNISVDELKRFKIEFETLKNTFNSPYIIEVYKYQEEENQYIMELMDMDLHEYIIEKNNNELSNAHRINICRQILKGMEHIHSKDLFHRDISPHNVLLNIYDDIVVVKIADFGWVKDFNSDMTNRDTAIKGAFNDISDLERVGFDKYHIKHETYALTRLLAFVLTGKINTTKIEDEKIKQFVDKGTSANMKNRFNSVQEISNHLTTLQ